LTSKISLDSVPLVDNHCHIGMYEQRYGNAFRTVRQLQEQYAQGGIEASLPMGDWREYSKALHGNKADRLREMDGRHGLRRLTDRTVQMFESTIFSRALEIGCTELHGEWADAELLAQAVIGSRREGLAPFYKRSLALGGFRIALVDTPYLDRALWPEEGFKWIARLDPFFYPFGPGAIAGRGTAIKAGHHARFTAELKKVLGEQGLKAIPGDLADYVAVAERALDSYLERGAVAFKVVSAYVRSLEFLPVSEREAARVFGDLSRGKRGESKLLEDYMAYRLLRWAAEREVPVQVHTGMGVPEPGMDFQQSNPLKLESVLMDESLNTLQLVLLHGAYPFCSEAGALTWLYGNVHLDFSWIVYIHHHFLIDRLSEWLEMLPAHKLLFGTDTGLPEMHLGASRLGRRALEAALSRGVEDGLWNPVQAFRLGERVCYRNACDLYGLSAG